MPAASISTRLRLCKSLPAILSKVTVCEKMCCLADIGKHVLSRTHTHTQTFTLRPGTHCTEGQQLRIGARLTGEALANKANQTTCPRQEAGKSMGPQEKPLYECDKRVMKSNPGDVT